MRNVSCLVFLSFIFLSACGGGENPDLLAEQKLSDEDTLSGKRFEEISESEKLNVSSSGVEGIGALRFTEALPKMESNLNYQIRFRLDDGGSLYLISHANNNLSQGVQIEFHRSDKKLKVFASASIARDDWSSFFPLDASSELSLSIDIHNSESGGHIVAWNQAKGQLLFNSSVDFNGGPGNGFGTRYGLKLSSGAVTYFETGEAREAH